jgi:hypothetical protein
MNSLDGPHINGQGDFFVECDFCLSCDAPRSEAPELMDYNEEGNCYFKRQPRTPEEVDHAINAVWISCIEAVHYRGNDPEILAQIEERFARTSVGPIPSVSGVVSKLSRFLAGLKGKLK